MEISEGIPGNQGMVSIEEAKPVNDTRDSGSQVADKGPGAKINPGFSDLRGKNVPAKLGNLHVSGRLNNPEPVQFCKQWLDIPG